MNANGSGGCGGCLNDTNVRDESSCLQKVLNEKTKRIFFVKKEEMKEKYKWKICCSMMDGRCRLRIL